ncbi:lipase secretion chaperone [Marinobacter sp. MDS2]|uniref:lipase secretion chaperone n=1 Tax=Marinobacter sp. MDS2 TaxID=3065961 RepID=UPI00273A8C04|nr:lipase secretion chaperone [Marinobacter sp. MDS2]MDP4546379.1 lipase secretion chaperone [Marinobacter sp. MDS2]
MSKRYIAVCFGVLLFTVSCAGLFFWLADGELGKAVRTVSVNQNAFIANHPESAASVQNSPDQAQELPALPRDERVADIQIDGAVRVDMNGNLVLDRQLRRFLDFFIGLAPGREYEPAMKLRMRAVMAANGVPGAVQAEVLDILDQYLAYRDASGQMELQAATDSADIFAAFDTVYRMRRTYLGPDVAEGFYGAEERRLRLALDRQSVMSDDSLSEAEKRRALAQIDQNLPEHVRKSKETSKAVVETVQRVQGMRQSGASEAEVRALRLQQYGAEATARLEEVDRERQQWQRRLSDYQRRKQAVMQSEGLAPGDRSDALRTLRESMFKGHELRRVRALDKMAETAG